MFFSEKKSGGSEDVFFFQTHSFFLLNQASWYPHGGDSMVSMGAYPGRNDRQGFQSPEEIRFLLRVWDLQTGLEIFSYEQQGTYTDVLNVSVTNPEGDTMALASVDSRDPGRGSLRWGCACECFFPLQPTPPSDFFLFFSQPVGSESSSTSNEVSPSG